MTLDDLGHKNMFFCDFRMRHTANCTVITRDKPGPPAYRIFSIKRRFQQSKSRFSTFKEACTCGHQKEVPPQNSLFYRCWLV